MGPRKSRGLRQRPGPSGPERRTQGEVHAWNAWTSPRTHASEDLQRHPGVRGFGISHLDLLHLVEADLDRGLAAEDRNQHLELRRVLVDLGDLAGEVRERAGNDLHGLADRELGARPRPLRGLAV